MLFKGRLRSSALAVKFACTILVVGVEAKGVRRPFAGDPRGFLHAKQACLHVSPVRRHRHAEEIQGPRTGLEIFRVHGPGLLGAQSQGDDQPAIFAGHIDRRIFEAGPHFFSMLGGGGFLGPLPRLI
jgi:hypothetical protein